MSKNQFRPTDLAFVDDLFYCFDISIVFLEVLKFVISFHRHAGSPFSVTKNFSEDFFCVFTPVPKNETLGINLLMDTDFKKILQLSRDNNNPLMRTFEGALFKDSGWFLFTETQPVAVTKADAPPVQAPEIPQAAPSKPVVIYGPTLCDVLFLGDSYKGEGEDLLGRMISAMKLKTGEFFRFPLNEELEQVSDLAANLTNPDQATRELFQFIQEKKPKVVVSLGAIITNILLGRREKLSGIHGQFFEKQIGDCHFSLMPVFHPDFLLINPNMKRTAWIDLQKVMERVGKI